MNEIIVRPPWQGSRSCGTCQNEQIAFDNIFYEVQRCPLTISEAKFLHAQVNYWGACIWWKPRYENHCWNCHNKISSQYCRRSTPNMGFVCRFCGKDLSEWKGIRVNTYA